MSGYDFTTKRLFVTADLALGASIETDRDQTNYLLNVMRMKADDPVLLFNGRDGEWLAKLAPKGRKACFLEVDRQTREQIAPYDLVYCFAPIKRARLDYMVQKAVEMGAGTLQPVITQHTQMTRLNLERMRANAREAAEQCGILTLPEIRAETDLTMLLSQWDPDRTLVFCDERASETDIVRLKELAGQPIAVLIGPEGGFSGEEQDAIRAYPFVQPISLGPRILRADTAAIAALAVVQLLVGDWRRDA